MGIAAAERTSALRDAGLGQRRRRVGADPAESEGAASVTRGVEPVGATGVVRGDVDPDPTVVVDVRGFVIHVGVVLKIVEGLEPVIADLEVPVVETLRRRELDLVDLVVFELPVAVEVDRVRVALGDGQELRIDLADLEGMLLE